MKNNIQNFKENERKEDGEECLFVLRFVSTSHFETVKYLKKFLFKDLFT